VAEIVLAYCSSHAPMMSSARMAAPEEQRNNFLGALARVRDEARARDVQACVVLSNEHYTNFFLENFPQICIGLGEKNWGPTEEWLPIDKVWIPGHAGLGNHIARYTLDHGFDPAFSHQLELDHGIMTVYYELDETMKLPLVPIVQNCAVPPLMPVRRAYEFGKALGEAIRSYDGLERVALIGAGGLSHWIGNPRVGDIDEEFDRWFLERLERGELDQVLDMQDDEIELAGNGNHEMRTWVAVAGAVAPVRAKTLAYEPVYPWITGMGVAFWETQNGQDQASATAAENSSREESLA
jgi:Catalytic LigB subunit of aromatic ring-opening dioxygenase